MGRELFQEVALEMLQSVKVAEPLADVLTDELAGGNNELFRV